jgi:hypothetical protein
MAQGGFSHPVLNLQDRAPGFDSRCRSTQPTSAALTAGLKGDANGYPDD